ncbi:response regulator [Rubripirellula amarantea]|nr:response regulator [Rubripirellula amarantea]
MKPENQVLLVEDNPDDVELTRESFRRTDRRLNLSHVGNGIECLKFLRKTEGYEDAPTPDLILLDLNMPIMDGREVLRALADDDQLKRHRVVVLTTSSSNTDLLVCHSFGCNAYVVKPVDVHEFQVIVNSICDFWFDAAMAPAIP